MTCPDKNKDKRIIAEVARRKATKAEEIEFESKYENYTWDGSLLDVALYITNLDNIVTIDHVGDQWIAKVKIQMTCDCTNTLEHIKDLAIKYAKSNNVKVQVYKQYTYNGTVYGFEEVQARKHIIMYISP